MNNAWVKLKLDDYNEVWDSFYDKFKFNLSIYSGNFSGILEPSPSVTYEISKDFGDGDKLADLNDKVLSALRSQTAPTEKIYVLDWQHDCYWFYPHKDFEEWFIPGLPDGEYHIFLAEDFRFGIFGHPWAWTSCVWGKYLISFLAKSKPAFWEKIIRQKS